MSLLEIKDISMSYGEKILFEEGSFELYKGEHMGLVGDNGSGKSTLLSILLDKELPDIGSVIWQKNIKIGYIDQYLKSEGNITVYEYLKTSFKDLFQLEETLNNLYEELSENYKENLMKKIGDIQDELEYRDFYSIESKIDRIVLGLGINSFGVNTKLENLSGGQQTKVILARLLLEQFDVLLLDEPTNFLDYEHILWLSEYLKEFQGAFIVVSHNLNFLNEITDCILDIEFTKLRKYYGNYERFLKLKEEYRNNYISNYNSQQEYIKRTENYIRKNKAGVNSKMARGRQKQLDRVERLYKPNTKKKPMITFREDLAFRKIELMDLEVGYDYSLLPKMNLNIRSGDKIAITGFNGIGKTTLLKTIVGILDPISGDIVFSKDTKISYYEQDLNWENQDMNALEIVSLNYPNMKIEEIRRELSKCGIEAEDLTQPIKTLSGGEQSKVKLCIMTLKEANILILDEPTNHLDKDTKISLKEALLNFNGTIVVVSHEKSFYEGLVDKVYAVAGNKQRKSK